MAIENADELGFDGFEGGGHESILYAIISLILKCEGLVLGLLTSRMAQNCQPVIILADFVCQIRDLGFWGWELWFLKETIVPIVEGDHSRDDGGVSQNLLGNEREVHVVLPFLLESKPSGGVNKHSKCAAIHLT